MGDDDAIGNSVKASVSFVISRVTEEGTEGGTVGKFVTSCGGKNGITLATKNTKMIVHRWSPK